MCIKFTCTLFRGSETRQSAQRRSATRRERRRRPRITNCLDHRIRLSAFSLRSYRHAAVSTKNRERLLAGEVAEGFFTAVLDQARGHGLLLDEHFTPWTAP